jgi:sorting nexin-1/2
MTTIKKIAVTDPQTENEGRRDAFTSYLVSTERHSVRRRYSDFQWLYGRLLTELPGAIVPIIPHKIAVGKKFDPDFVELRRRNLQVFLNIIFKNEEFLNAPSMKPFLLDKYGLEFDTGRRGVEAANPTSNLSLDDEASSTVKKVSHLFAKASTLVRVRAGTKDLVPTAEEARIERIQDYVSMVESQVKSLVASAEHLTVATGHISQVVGEMNDPIREWRAEYQLLANSPDEVSDMMSALLEFTSDYSHLMNFKHREEQLEFEDVMHRLKGDVRAFKVALKQRRHWQVALTTTMQQLATKDEQISKALHHLKPPEVTEKLSQERSELELLAGREKLKLEACTDRFLKEAGQSKQRLELQLKEAFFKYAKIQISYTDRINTAWKQLLPYVSDVEKTNGNHHNVVENAGGIPEEEEDEAPPPPPSESFLHP